MSAIDYAFRVMYRVAYRLMRVYWFVRRPNTHGALVAVWHDGRILLIQNSYTNYRSLPGGYVRRNETGRQAALRELAEEVGIVVEIERLEPTVDRTDTWEGKTDRVEIFTLEVDTRPDVQVDRREVVAAEFVTPDVARTLSLFPPVSEAIDKYVAASEG